MGAWQRIKAADRINRALAGNAKIEAIIDALTVLQITRIDAARTGNYFQELCEEYALAQLIAKTLSFDLENTLDEIRDELRSRYSYDIVEGKSINPKTGELAA